MSANTVNAGLSLLFKVISTLEAGLKSYSQKENPNPVYVQKQNELIQSLVSVYNAFDELTYLETWLQVEQEMKRLEKQDKQIGGHTISFSLGKGGRYYSLININPFQS